MHIDLSSRVAVVTGGANGIGLATARRLAASGAKVAIWDRVVDAGEAAVAALAADGHAGLFVATDVTDRASVDAAVVRTVSHYGAIDILINNAGITRDAQLVKVKDGVANSSMNDAEFDAVIAVNLKGVFECTQAVAETMTAQGSGSIVNASSVVGLYGNFGQTNYAATKAGVIGFTKTWARELGPKGVRVNAVCPGFVLTPILDTVPDAVKQKMIEKVPLGRLGRPEEIAAGYAFLASDDSSYLNGAVLEVSGGIQL